jgi:hypothetical protein
MRCGAPRAVPAWPMRCTWVRLSLRGSACLLCHGVYTLYTIHLFRPSPKAALNLQSCHLIRRKLRPEYAIPAATLHTRVTSRHVTLCGGDEPPCHKGFPMGCDRHRHTIPARPLHDTTSQRLQPLCPPSDVHIGYKEQSSTSLSYGATSGHNPRACGAVGGSVGYA